MLGAKQVPKMTPKGTAVLPTLTLYNVLNRRK